MTYNITTRYHIFWAQNDFANIFKNYFSLVTKTAKQNGNINLKIPMYSIYTKQGINYSISVPNMIYGREMMFQDNFQIYINLSFLFVFSINSQNSKVSTSFPKRLKVRLPQPSPYFTLIKLKKKKKKLIYKRVWPTVWFQAKLSYYSCLNEFQKKYQTSSR